MFKRDFLREIIPDAIIALGFFLLFMGLFTLFPDKTVLERNLESKEILTSEGQTTDKFIGLQEIVLELPEVDEGLEINLAVGEERGEEENIAEKMEEDTEEYVEEDIIENMVANLEENKNEDLELFTEDVKQITIIIPEGSTGRQVASILDEEGLIPFDDFIDLLLLFDIETRIRAGEYTFNSDSGIVDVLTKILIKRR